LRVLTEQKTISGMAKEEGDLQGIIPHFTLDFGTGFKTKLFLKAPEKLEYTGRNHPIYI
jgi:hypothetical protein